jgi:hypothetical protein
MSIGFSEVMTRKSFQTAQLLAWFQNPLLAITSPQRFHIAGLVLGYVTIILSWVFYHRSIIRHPIRVENRDGFVRFLFDIMLLVLYWLLLVEFDSVVFQLELVLLIFFVFTIWDQFKLSEHHMRDSSEDRKRAGVSTFWFLVFLLLYVSYFYQLGRAQIQVDWYDGVFLILAIVFTVLYRVHKRWPRPRLLLDPLGGPRSRSTSLRIYVAGPYTAPSLDKIESNVNAAIDAGIEVFRRGHFPYVPHLTHFVDKRANEIGKPLQWEDFIVWDRAWLGKAEAILYLGSSPGADLELKLAISQGKKVFRSIDDVPTVKTKPGVQ